MFIENRRPNDRFVRKHADSRIPLAEWIEKVKATRWRNKLEVPQSVISEFLGGKRGISKSLVLKLAEHFRVSPELF